MPASVVIAGGGISGLVTAYRLLQAEPGLDLVLLESQGRLGGTMGTEVVERFAFERGPNGFLDNVPHTIELSRELELGERLLPASSAAKKRFLLRRGKLHPLPASFLEFLRSPLLSVGGRFRVLREPFQSRCAPGEEDSVASFGRRRLGDEATSTFLDPFVTGIFAGDVERLSLPSAFPRIAALESEHGSLWRGMLARSRERRKAARTAAEPMPAGPAGGVSGPGGRLHSFPGGLEDLVAALKGRLGPRARLNALVEAVRPKAGAFEVCLKGHEVLRASAVVLALPAPRAANVVSGSNQELATDLEQIPYAPVAVVCLGYARASVEHPLDGFGFLVPRDEGPRTLGAIFVSTLFPCHAPEGTASLRILLGGARDPEAAGLSAEDLLDLVAREVGPILGIRGEPLARRVYRYLQGIPQYNLGHAKRVRRVEGWLRRTPGLFVTGNAYRGVGVNDCVADAGRVAGDVIAFLRGRAGAA